MPSITQVLLACRVAVAAADPLISSLPTHLHVLHPTGAPRLPGRRGRRCPPVRWLTPNRPRPP